jgi:thioredoxin-related protein
MTKTILSFAFLLILNLNNSFSQEVKGGLTWYSDIKKADELSKSSGKPIFAFFTGSDWCGWCMRLQKDVFSKQAFIDWAKKNVVLVELDFPRRKQLPPEIAQQNMSLQQALQVQGYPTVWLMTLEQDKASTNVNINTLGSLGYPSGAEPGKEEVMFLENANGMLKKK